MKGLIIALLVVCAISFALCADEEELAFQQFITQYNKAYSSKAEYTKRLQVFKDNLNFSRWLDQQDPHATYGVTKFMDLTRKEFKDMYLTYTPPANRSLHAPGELPRATVPHADLPTSFDWNSKGVVTSVYNQGQCGSCWAFSVTENIESMWAIAGKGLQNLAMQQLVDCDPYDGGCNGGNPPRAYQYLIQNGGIDNYNSYPYAGYQQGCRFNPNAVSAKISNWGYITTSDNENYMAQWTYQYGPPSVCLDAQTWQYYQGGVITQNCGTQLDHCVQLTGWQVYTGIQAWTIRNSWGSDWGMSGYVLLETGADMCGVGTEVTSSVI
jgi:cysteine peptidase B